MAWTRGIDHTKAKCPQQWGVFWSSSNHMITKTSCRISPNTFLSSVCLRKERRPSLRKLIIIPILIPQGGSIFTLHFRFCTTHYSAKSQLGVEISEGVHSYFQASAFLKILYFQKISNIMRKTKKMALSVNCDNYDVFIRIFNCNFLSFSWLQFIDNNWYLSDLDMQLIVISQKI